MNRYIDDIIKPYKKCFNPSINRFFKLYELIVDNKLSCVYFLQNKNNKLTKIGKTNDVEKRFRQLKSNLKSISNSDCSLKRIIICSPSEISSLEKQMHSWYKDKWVHNEWFDLNEFTDCFINDDYGDIENIDFLITDSCDQSIITIDLIDDLYKDICSQVKLKMLVCPNIDKVFYDSVSKAIDSSKYSKMTNYLKSHNIKFVDDCCINNIIDITNGIVSVPSLYIYGSNNPKIISLTSLFENKIKIAESIFKN